MKPLATIAALLLAGCLNPSQQWTARIQREAAQVYEKKQAEQDEQYERLLLWAKLVGTFAGGAGVMKLAGKLGPKT